MRACVAISSTPTVLPPCQEPVDIYISGFTCKLFSQESSTRYADGNVKNLFSSKDPKVVTKNASCRFFFVFRLENWRTLENTYHMMCLQHLSLMYLCVLAKAAKALPFIESSRWIRANSPKKTSCNTFPFTLRYYVFLWRVCFGGCAAPAQDCNPGECHGHDQTSGENVVLSGI